MLLNDADKIQHLRYSVNDLLVSVSSECNEFCDKDKLIWYYILRWIDEYDDI